MQKPAIQEMDENLALTVSNAEEVLLFMIAQAGEQEDSWPGDNS